MGLHKTSKSTLMTNDGNANWFEVSSGVRQGCVLALLLFVINSDRINTNANGQPGELNKLIFADDQSIIHAL